MLKFVLTTPQNFEHLQCLEHSACANMHPLLNSGCTLLLAGCFCKPMPMRTATYYVSSGSAFTSASPMPGTGCRATPALMVVSQLRAM